VSEQKGTIFCIQRFSIQDGPGIRSTVFFKGCPLSCKWCSNPESQKTTPELMVRYQNCQKCRACIEVCEQNAIKVVQDVTVIDRTLCNDCFECVDVCCSEALDTTGTQMSLEDILDEVCRDELFYKNSGGGVTLSGGEPLLQYDFALELLKQLKMHSIDTTIDTCGFFKWDRFKPALDYTDRILFDIKHLDSELHEKETGVGNELILANLDQLIEDSSVEVWIRIPVISGFNDTDEFFEHLKTYLANRQIEKISLLAYHKWGTAKYTYLGKEYPWQQKFTCEQDELERYKTILERGGHNVTIGF
jgi:pyruvate formate lyase activating enzyme